LERLESVKPAIADQKLSHLADNDQTVSQNYLRLVSNAFEDLYERAPADQTIGDFRRQTLGEIGEMVQRLFPGLSLNSLGNPLTVGTFRFDKGDSSSFHYMNLSGGEKAAFDLLLDLLVKRGDYDNAVYFIDEPEAHLAPHLQGVLLTEMLRVIPDNSQLWLASHSISMMRKAREIATQEPGSVAFYDFEGENFDIPTTLKPVAADRPFWKRAMRVALDDMAGFVTPEEVVLCEGGGTGNASDFDAECYNEIFKIEHPATLFMSAGNSYEVQTDPRGFARLLKGFAPSLTVRKLIDRDDRHNAEIEELRSQGISVLSQRTLESYLLSDGVLTAVCATLGQPALSKKLLAAKSAALANSHANGGPLDDLKRAAGDIYNEAKRLFPTHKLGGDKRAFMKGICAPLVAGTSEYKILKKDIFGEAAR
jgi:hypothetical protein